MKKPFNSKWRNYALPQPHMPQDRRRQGFRQPTDDSWKNAEDKRKPQEASNGSADADTLGGTADVQPVIDAEDGPGPAISTKRDAGPFIVNGNLPRRFLDGLHELNASHELGDTAIIGIQYPPGLNPAAPFPSWPQPGFPPTSVIQQTNPYGPIPPYLQPANQYNANVPSTPFVPIIGADDFNRNQFQLPQYLNMSGYIGNPTGNIAYPGGQHDYRSYEGNAKGNMPYQNGRYGNQRVNPAFPRNHNQWQPQYGSRRTTFSAQHPLRTSALYDSQRYNMPIETRTKSGLGAGEAYARESNAFVTPKRKSPPHRNPYPQAGWQASQELHNPRLRSSRPEYWPSETAIGELGTTETANTSRKPTNSSQASTLLNDRANQRQTSGDGPDTNPYPADDNAFPTPRNFAPSPGAEPVSSRGRQASHIKSPQNGGSNGIKSAKKTQYKKKNYNNKKKPTVKERGRDQMDRTERSLVSNAQEQGEHQDRLQHVREPQQIQKATESVSAEMQITSQPVPGGLPATDLLLPSLNLPDVATPPAKWEGPPDSFVDEVKVNSPMAPKSWAQIVGSRLDTNEAPPTPPATITKSPGKVVGDLDGTIPRSS